MPMGDVRGTYIAFDHDPSFVGKTSLWRVRTTKGWHLGYVKWFGRWRKYSFFPEEGSVFEEVCMREISDFIVARTQEHKRG